jgi:hypothetical protein
VAFLARADGCAYQGVIFQRPTGNVLSLTVVFQGGIVPTTKRPSMDSRAKGNR